MIYGIGFTHRFVCPELEERMSRKKYPELALTRLPAGTGEAISLVLEPGEQQAAFHREAVALLAAVRSLKIYAELKPHLLNNESRQEFFVKAISKAVKHRITALEKGR
jgi:hypothetical protein